MKRNKRREGKVGVETTTILREKKVCVIYKSDHYAFENLISSTM